MSFQNKLFARSMGILSAEGITDLLEAFEQAALFIGATHYKVIAANAKAQQLLGFSAAEFSKIFFSQLCTADVQNFLKNNQRNEAELLLRNQSGVASAFWVSATPIHSESDAYWVIQFHPIVDQQRLTAAMHFRERLLDTLAEVAQLLTQPTPADFYQPALSAWAALIQAGTAAIYLGKEETGPFQRIAQEGELSNLPPTFLGRPFHLSTNPYLLNKGRRVPAFLRPFEAVLVSHQMLGVVCIGSTSHPVGVVVFGLQAGALLEGNEILLTLFAAFVFQRHMAERAFSLAEYALQQERYKTRVFQQLYENSKDIVFLFGHDRVIIEVNPAAEGVFGYERAEMVGQLIENIVVGAFSIHQLLQNALAGETSAPIGMTQLHRRTGETFAASLQCVPILQNKRVVHFALMIMDLSENEELRAQSRQLEQKALLGEIIMAFAHEVRNPVNNISGNLRLLKMNFEGDSYYYDRMTRIEQDCDRLIHLMDSALSSSRPIEYIMTPVDIEDLLTRLVDRWKSRLQKANVSVRFSGLPGAAQVLADKRALDQVFSNLIDNAVSAMGANGGVLGITIQDAREADGKDYVEVIISDTGVGIADDLKERIFTPLFTTKETGTGLGLAISRRIITLHKGKIHLETFPGGTLFHVVFPRYAESGVEQ